MNYYDWVPFFQAICKEIAIIANDTKKRDYLLYEKAKDTFKSDHAILKVEKVDPFSYIYALAQRNTKYQAETYFLKTKEAFNIDLDIPTDRTFPVPSPNTLSLFYDEGKYVNKEGADIGNNSIWNLFLAVFNNDEIPESDFHQVISLKNVRITKLSQVFFLINPFEYIPFDTQMNSLPIPELADLKGIVKEIEEKGFPAYKSTVQKIKDNFPGCQMYEVNLLNVSLNFFESDQLKVSNKYCQVSSWAYGQKNKDYFDKFVNKNGAWVGGPAGETGQRKYPLTEFDRGDIILIRRGTKKLGGIAIIDNNQYIPDGFADEKMINLLWLIKDNRNSPEALGQWDGFSEASDKTLKIFKDIYPNTFKLIDYIRQRQKTMVDHSKNKFKNIIFQGPPGTGKTRLAKQVAKWLTSDPENGLTLMNALSENNFTSEPEIDKIEEIKLIQFHPSFTYEDFVRGITANIIGDKVAYAVENKTLVDLAEKASKPENREKAFVLIIDEINRANLSSVLGELIYALEYRGEGVESMYLLEGVGKHISLPSNLYILGTMNTADRSIGHIDYAIRRRFAFVDVEPQEKVIDEVISEPPLNKKAKEIFKKVASLFYEKENTDDITPVYLAPDFRAKDVQIGHSYFLAYSDDELKAKLKYEIIPILDEYIKDGVLLEDANQIIKQLHDWDSDIS